MKKLKLPSYNYKIKEKDGKPYIYDRFRRKFIMVTPEEWVRQHFLNYLVSVMEYPRSMVKVETGVKYNQLNKRTDILIYHQSSPFMVVECKSYESSLNKEVLYQILAYNRSLNAPYLVLTNGMGFYCLERLDESKSRWLKELPPFPR